MYFRIKYSQQIVGLFLLIALTSLVVTFLLMNSNQRWFARNYTFYTYFLVASNITVGKDIRLMGFEIGKVSAFRLNSMNQISVTFQIYEEHYDKIKPDSVIELDNSPSFLGGGSLQFLPGKNTLPPMEEYSFIPSTDTLMGKNLVVQGLANTYIGDQTINSIINALPPLLGSINEGVNSINKAVITIDKVVAGNTDKALGRVVALLDNINKISEDLSTLSHEIKDPRGLVPKLLDAKGSIASFLDDHNQFYDQLYKIITQVSQAMTSINALATYFDQSTPQISGIMEGARSTLKKTDDVLVGLANNPLLRGGIPQKSEPSGTISGARVEDF